MSRLLLLSSSRVHPTGFLEHCRSAIAEHFDGVSRILFIPWALHDHDHYEAVVSEALQPLGLTVDSIHRAADPRRAMQQATGIFIGGGNTFRLLRRLYAEQLLEPIRQSVIQRDIPYMGSSAGTNMASPTIRTTNDMPIVEPPSLAALGLVPFQINPHFLDADPNSTHKGETREQRLAEYLEENDVPVLGLREGSWLVVQNGRYRLAGSTGARWFAREKEPQELSAGDLTALLGSN